MGSASPRSRIPRLLGAGRGMVGDRQAVARGLRKTRSKPQFRLTSSGGSADKPDMNPQMYPGMSARGRIVCRLAAVACLAAAFLVMASVFSPQRSKAGDLESVRDGADATSTDPHEGLRSLGSLESRAHIVQMYSTPDGARYSIYDR